MKLLLIIRSRYSTVVTNTRWHEILLQYRSQNWGDRSAQYWPNYWLFKLCGGTWGDIWDHLSYSVPCWPRWSHEQHIFWVADVWWPVLVDKDKTESTDIKSEGESWETCKGCLTRSYRPDGHGVDVMLTVLSHRLNPDHWNLRNLNLDTHRHTVQLEAKNLNEHWTTLRSLTSQRRK